MAQQMQALNTRSVPETDKALYEVLIDNDTVRVSRWLFKPGQQSGWHHHELDYMGLHSTRNLLRYEMPDGRVETKDQIGISGFIKAGAEHNVTNVGSTDAEAYEIEFKR
jgi:mannose-6-phosphate isomerase-like protein (cupin superfamily)